MTRINSAIPVENLTDEHLIAEHLEISRLPGCLLRAIKSGSVNKIPKEFTLGEGHVTFFIDKSGFTKKRFIEIHNECLKRGFNVQDYSNSWDVCDDIYMNDYKPTKKEYNILLDRIEERIINSPKKYFHYNHERISKELAIKIIKNGNK